MDMVVVGWIRRRLEQDRAAVGKIGRQLAYGRAAVGRIRWQGLLPVLYARVHRLEEVRFPDWIGWRLARQGGGWNRIGRRLAGSGGGWHRIGWRLVGQGGPHPQARRLRVQCCVHRLEEVPTPDFRTTGD